MEKTRSVYARLHTPQQGTALFLLCWAAYAAAYVGRYNYSAVMGAMTAEGVLTLQAAGAVSTGYFLCYAAGQVLSGFACQWVSPYRMIFAGLALSGLCNLGMAALPAALMPVLWAANGLFQAMVWPPIVRLFAECMPLALALLAVTTAAMLGINTLFINVIPVRAGRSGGAAALSGLLNAVTYVGAAAATWGVGVAADSWGWSAVFILWLAMAVVSLVTVLLCAGRWARFTAEQEEV